MAAGKINLSHHALADPLRVVAFHHAPDEFMARNAVKTRIAFQDFAVRSADARQQDFYQCLAWRTPRLGDFKQGEFSIEIECFHSFRLPIADCRMKSF
jgi:hypothetical protein